MTYMYMVRLPWRKYLLYCYFYGGGGWGWRGRGEAARVMRNILHRYKYKIIFRIINVMNAKTEHTPNGHVS